MVQSIQHVTEMLMRCTKLVPDGKYNDENEGMILHEMNDTEIYKKLQNIQKH